MINGIKEIEASIEVFDIAIKFCTLIKDDDLISDYEQSRKDCYDLLSILKDREQKSNPLRNPFAHSK